MSSEKGNIKRTRPQKYKNSHSFKNNLYDKSHVTKTINNIQVCNVCERCKKIIEWKIKYKKFKLLKAPGTCTKCLQKTVKHAYHTICTSCARDSKVCPKCGTDAAIVEHKPSEEEQIKLDAEMRSMLKTLPERKRRTFMRYINRGQSVKKKTKKESTSSSYKPKSNSLNVEISSDSNSGTEDEEDEESGEKIKEEIKILTREDVISKLKSLMLDKDEDGSENNSDCSESDLDF